MQLLRIVLLLHVAFDAFCFPVAVCVAACQHQGEHFVQASDSACLIAAAGVAVAD